MLSLATVCYLLADGLHVVGNAWVTFRMENAAEATSTVSTRSPFDRTGKKPSTRSKLSNGKILPLNDGRSATARRFKDLVEDIASDLGGKAHLSEGQRQLIRRAANAERRMRAARVLGCTGRGGVQL
jgi:hypothetical protein